MDRKHTNLPFKQIKKTLLFSLSIYWHDSKIVLIFCALAVFLRVAFPFLSILIPKLALDQIQLGDMLRFLLVVGGSGLLLTLMNYLKSYTDSIVDQSIRTVGIMQTILRKSKKTMHMDYALMEDPDAIAIENRADKVLTDSHSLAMNIPKLLVELLTNALGLSLYTGIILKANPIILILLVISAGINSVTLRHSRQFARQTRADRSEIYSQFRTLLAATRAPEAAKDMRLYGAQGWLNRGAKKLLRRYEQAEDKVAATQQRAEVIDAVLAFICDGFAYAFLINLVINGELTLGDFVLSFAAIGAFSGWISGVLLTYGDLSKACAEMTDVQLFLDYPDRTNISAGTPVPTDEASPPTFSFVNVGYTYPHANAPTLCDINLTIQPGERIAIVGANGAGKSTMAKLLCGLYQPTVGMFCINDQPVSAFDTDAYFSLFSAVFQDIYLLSCDIAGNVSQRPPEETDAQRVWHCLALAGLAEKVQSLPEQEKTLLVKSVNPGAIELSGGEKQKLSIARALYKNAPVLLLDEPTAALDPIAENEVYQKYAELTKGKTSFFISHRLASTRFCDRILLIEGSRIAEEGTHEELMRQDGTYARMFNVQASYYQNEPRVEETNSDVND